MNFDGIEAVMYTGGRSERLPSRPLPEAQIMELRETLKRYTAFCPFKVGDLVTPRTNAPMHDAGLPHLVVEVFHSPYRANNEEMGTWPYLAKVDMRVISMKHGEHICPAAVESWMFEPYTGEGADAQPEPAEAKPHADGWIAWHGGECPVDANALVEIDLRDAATMTGHAEEFIWDHSNEPGDIMRYRVIF